MSRSDGRISAIAYRALDLLFLKHPLRTSLGVIVGFVIILFVDIFSPSLATLRYIDVYRANPALWIAFGIFTMHIPTIVYLFKGARGNEDVEDALRLIREAPLSDSERRAKYRALINMVMQNSIENSGRGRKSSDPGVPPSQVT